MAKRTIEHLDTLIARNERRLKLTMTRLDKLKKERRRMTTKKAVAAVLDPMIAALKPGPITIEVTRHPAPMFDGPTEKVVVFEPDNAVDTVVNVPVVAAVAAEANRVSDDLGIPDFLRRGQAAQAAADKVVADSIRQEMATKAKARSAARIAKMKAKKSGETKKMPLSGKAALDAIRNG
jgi:hypothetical protein